MMLLIAAIPWENLAAQSVILTFIAALLAFLLVPRAKTWLWGVLESDKAKLQSLVEDCFQEELETLTNVKAMTESHEDALEFVKASLQSQGEELRQLPRIAASMEQQARSFKEMTITLSKIHAEVTEHGKQFAKWDGFMEGQEGKWLGGDRRKIKRRTEDHDP